MCDYTSHMDSTIQCSKMRDEVLTLTCVLVWRVRTLYWTGLCLHSPHPPLPHHRCPRLPLGSLAPLNSPPAPYASLTTPPAEQTRQNIISTDPYLHLSDTLCSPETKPSPTLSWNHSTLLDPVLGVLLPLLSCCLL